ncbi:MAG: hypothetical protein ACRC8K_19400 [Waterburya sp.]
MMINLTLFAVALTQPWQSRRLRVRADCPFNVQNFCTFYRLRAIDNLRGVGE